MIYLKQINKKYTSFYLKTEYPTLYQLLVYADSSAVVENLKWKQDMVINVKQYITD